jgi:hypothetical protein
MDGDLGYATDRRSLYRWDGANWYPLTTYSYSGLHLDRPDPTDVPLGSLYYETDTLGLYQNQVFAWVWIAANPSAFVGLDGSVTKTADAGANWLDWDLSATLPAGCRAVELAGAGNPGAIGARKNGTALGRVLPNASSSSPTSIICEPDASNIIEVYWDGAAAKTYKLMGYWS